VSLSGSLYKCNYYYFYYYTTSHLRNSTRFELRAIAVSTVFGRGVRRDYRLWASQSLIRWWYADLHQRCGHQCTSRIGQWMGSNWLKLNQDMTMIFCIGTRQQSAKVSTIELTLPSAKVSFSTTVSDLGFIVDSQLNMSDHVAWVPLVLLSTVAATSRVMFVDARRS